MRHQRGARGAGRCVGRTSTARQATVRLLRNRSSSAYRAASDAPSRPPPRSQGGVACSEHRLGAREGRVCPAVRRDGPSSRPGIASEAAAERALSTLRDSDYVRGPLPPLLGQLEQALEHVHEQAGRRVQVRESFAGRHLLQPSVSDQTACSACGWNSV